MDEKLRNQIVNFLLEKVSPDLIYIFGSTIKGTSNSNSDVDLAYLSEKSYDEYEIFMIAQELAAIVNLDIDLIDLNKASTVFQAQIVSTGKTIYSLDENKRMNFEMKTYKMYAKLNEERKVIIDRVRESGAIFNAE
jgi:predicted nucleotidyltransferase